MAIWSLSHNSSNDSYGGKSKRLKLKEQRGAGYWRHYKASSQGKLFMVQLCMLCFNHTKRPFLLREKECLGWNSRCGLSPWILGGDLSPPPWSPNVWAPVIWIFKTECSSPSWDGSSFMWWKQDMVNSLPFFFFFGCTVASGILVPWPGIEPVPPALEAPNLNHWTARDVPWSKV